MPDRMKVFRPIKATLKTQIATDRKDDPRQRALNSRYWRKLRLEAIRQWVQEHGPYCGDCQCALTFGQDMHVDHVIPHSGMNDPLFSDLSNTRVLCRTCHAIKTRKDTTGGGIHP